MPKLPRVTAEEVIKVLKKRGFKLVRQSGSHMIFRNDKGKRGLCQEIAVKRPHVSSQVAFLHIKIPYYPGETGV